MTRRARVSTLGQPIESLRTPWGGVMSPSVRRAIVLLIVGSSLSASSPVRSATSCCRAWHQLQGQPCTDPLLLPPTYDQAGESYEVTPTLVYDGQGIIMSSGAYVRSTYGGGNFTVCFNTSTYRWAGQEWAQVNVSTPSRVHHAMAYDASRDEVVLFGGSGDYDASWDTWIWSRSTASWTLGNESPTLGARSGHRLVYDPGCGRVLLIGGKSSLGGPPPTETWAWDGNASQWSRGAPAATGPSSLQDDFEVMSDDASGRALVCDGGSLWGWTYDHPHSE